MNINNAVNHFTEIHFSNVGHQFMLTGMGLHIFIYYWYFGTIAMQTVIFKIILI